MRSAVRALLAASTLFAAACNVSAEGAIPCFDDAACPRDYPRCDATPGAQGFCKAAGPGETASGSVKIVGAQGYSAGSPVRGKVRVDVAAKATSGIKSVSLTAQGSTTAFPQIAAVPPVYTFEVDTAAAGATGQITLQASIEPGDGSAPPQNDTLVLVYDNKAPVLALTSFGPLDSRAGSVVVLDLSSDEPLSQVSGAITGPAGTVIATAARTALPGSTVLNHRLTWQVPADATAGTYSLAVTATDAVGNVTTSGGGIAAQTFKVRLPFSLSSVTALSAAGASGKLGSTITAQLTLPASVDVGPNKPSFTLIDAAGHRRAFLGTPTVAASGATNKVWTVADSVSAADVSGNGSLEAAFDDPSGNHATIATGFTVDKDAPIATSVAVTAPFVDAVNATQPIALQSNEPVSASITTSNGDTGTCAAGLSTAPSCTVTLSNPAAATNVTATVTLTDAVGNVSTALAQYALVPAPSATSLVPSAANVTAGGSVQLTPTFTHGTGTVNGVGVTSGQPLTVTPGATTTYTLIVTNPAGHTAQTTATVTVVGPPSITSFTAAATSVTTGTGTTLTGVFAGGTGSIDQGIGSVASAGVLATGNLTTTKTYTLTVTNAAGTAVTASVTVNVVAVASASLSIQNGTSPLTLTAGGSANLVPVCGAGQTGTMNQAIGGIQSNTAVAVAPSAPTTTYTLTCVNAAGAQTSASVIINTVAAPVINSFSANTTITAGTITTLSFAFTGGTGDVNGTAVTSGGTLDRTPATTTTYTLTVHNAATTQAVVTQSITVTVIPAPVATSLTATTTNIAAGQSVTLTPLFSAGTGAIDNGVGAVQSLTPYVVTPAVTTTYTLTVTNPIGAVATKTVTINVSPAPTISSFTVATPTIDATNSSLTFNFAFANGTAAIGNGVGAVTGTTKTIITSLPTITTDYVLTVTGANSSTATATARVTVVPVLSASDSFTSSAANVTLGNAVTLTPSFAAGETATFNGTPVTSGQGVGVTPTAVGTATYTLVISNAAGHTQNKVATVNVVAAPSITAFNASAVSVGSGASITLSYNFSGGTGAITGSAGTGIPINGIAGAGTSTVTAPATSTNVNVSYTLTITNAANVTDTATVNVLVVPAPSAALTFTAPSTGGAINVNPHDSVTLQATFAGGNATLNGAALSASPATVTINNVTQTTSYTLVVTSAAGTTQPATAVATVNAAIYSFSVSPAFATTGVSTAFTFTGSHEGGGSTGAAAGDITGSGITGTLALASGTNKTAALTTTLAGTSSPYTLTVKNSANTPVTQTATVTVVAAPVGTSLTPASSTVTVGESVALTPVFTNDPGGTAVLQKGGVAVTTALTSGTPVSVVPALGANTYTLVVTNRAGAVHNTVQASATAVAAPITPTPITAPANVTASGTAFAASVPNRGAGFTYAWTVSGGSITGGQNTSAITFNAPASTGPLLLSCDEVNAAGEHSAPATLQINVVAAPAAPAITAQATVTTAVAGQTASVVANPGMTYTWSVTAGTSTATITSSTAGVFANGLNTVTFTPGAAGTFNLVCVEKNAANVSSGNGTKAMSIVAAPVQPGAITAGVSGNVTTGAVGLTASVPQVGTNTYAWTINGGTITAGQGTNAITYTVTGGAGGTLVLTAAEVNGAGTASAAQTKSLNVVAAPVQPTINTSFNSVTVGSGGNSASVVANPGMTYAWSISGTGAAINAGGATASITYTAASSGNVTLSVTESNAAGVTSSAGTKTLTGVAGPATPVITAANNVTAGGAGFIASVAAQGTATFAWTITNGVITAGQGTNSITYSAGSVGALALNVTATVTASGATAAAAQKNVTVVAPPTAPAITVASLNVTSGAANLTATGPNVAGMNYAWTINNKGTIVSGAATNQLTYSVTPAVAGDVIVLTLTETNAAGVSSAASSITQTVFGAVSTPTITSAGTVTTASTGNTASIVGAKPGMTYTWSVGGGIGTVTSGQGLSAIVYTAPNSTGSFFLTATETNGAGAVSSAGSLSVNVVSAPSVPTVTSAEANVPNRGSGHATTAAQGTVTFNWSVTGGTVTAGQGTTSMTYTVTGAPGSTVSITATATNAAGTVSASSTPATALVTAGSWRSAADFPVAVFGATITRLNDGRILVAGGAPTAAGTPTNTAYICNVIGASCAATVNNMSSKRISHTATLLPSGKVLVAGGYVLAGGGTPTASVDLFDPTTNSFTAVPGGMGLQRAGHTATLLVTSGGVLIAGGTDGASTHGTTERYDIALNSVGGSLTMKEARRDHVAVALSATKVLLAGSGTTGKAEVYDSADDSFTYTTNALDPYLKGTNYTATLLSNGNVLIAGGFVSGATSALTALYTTATNTLSAGSAMYDARYQHTAVRLSDNRVLVCGGLTTGGAATVTCEAFVANGVGSIPSGYLATARSQAASVLLSDNEVVMLGGMAATTGSGELYTP